MDRHVGSNVDWACCESGAYMQITPSPPRRAPPSALAAEGEGEGRRPALAHGGGWGAEGPPPELGREAAQGRGKEAAVPGPRRPGRRTAPQAQGERERRGGRSGDEAAAARQRQAHANV